jgi:excisionase family DNA binding protein
MDNQLLISKREAAATLGVSIRTLENLISLKELPARRIGRRCLIERRALEIFAKRDHKTRPEVEPSISDRGQESQQSNKSPREARHAE